MSPTKISEVKLLRSLDALFQRELPNIDSSLASAASYHFKNPGKSFRAQLALSSGLALGLDEHENLHWAAACELLHNASLIHDDISDASTHRRGQKSINEYFGSDLALCLGDWMVAKAFELAARNSRHGGALVAVLAKAMQETCSGQTADITQRQCAELKEWQRIAKGKTAPLLITPIKGAALAAGLYCSVSGFEALGGLEKLVGFCGLAYQGRNDIDDIIPSSHRSSDLDGRKPNLVISLFALQGNGRDEFNTWYQSEDKSLLAHWQRRIASSDVILKANQSIDYWLLQADQLVNTLPAQLQPVARELVVSVKHKTAGRRQGRIA
ncbi:MAG: geranylgeranyl pyrophosphate synthase [Candidatus Endobugula sp.]|jgi:geranylgeranyl pyrophosphate synthase